MGNGDDDGLPGLYKLTCPVCFAARACAELQRALDRGMAVVERSGMARGMLEALASADRGWRFCPEHVPEHVPHGLHLLGTDDDGCAIYAPEDGPGLTARGITYWTDTDGCHHAKGKS